MEKTMEEILKKHKKWINGEEGGAKAKFTHAVLKKIDFKGADLREADFSCADLTGANFSYADLRGANFNRANLSKANFEYADLRNTRLKNALLNDAILSYADLKNANLNRAHLKQARIDHARLECATMTAASLRETILRYSNMIGVSLDNANLRDVDLRNCDLSCASIMGTNFKNSYLNNAELERIHMSSMTSFFSLACPEEGSFIGYKKAQLRNSVPVIVKIMITEDAKRSSATTRKCRCSKAKVLSITSIDGKTSFNEAISKFDNSFLYKIDEIIEVKNFDEDRWKECSTGIHFFITREEAVNYK